MKLLLLIILFPLSALGVTWEEYLAQKKLSVSHHRHLPYRLTHGHKTEKSVVLIHGIYSSPLYFRAMANAYFNAGHNVITVLLPGNWDKNIYQMKKTTNEDWSREVDIGYELALELGHKVILSGHSLGGLLSIEQALKREDSRIHSLVLISPSLKVWNAVLAACSLGVALNLDGNTFNFTKPDGIQIPSYDPIAGHLIQNLANRVLTKKITVPVFMAFTWDDSVVNVNFLNKYYKAMSVDKRLVRFKISSGILHGDISQGPTDALAYGARANPEFDLMMENALNFVENLPDNSNTQTNLAAP